jgi:hypothetical protein
MHDILSDPKTSCILAVSHYEVYTTFAVGIRGGKHSLLAADTWFYHLSSAESAASEAVLRRVTRFADGWSPNIPTNADGKHSVAWVYQYAQEAERDPAALSLD